MSKSTNDFPIRYLENTDPCGSCTGCASQKLCDPIRTPDMRHYGGIRFTADGFDCALPVTVDSHSVCSYACVYCFSEQLQGHYDARTTDVGETSLKALRNIFEGKGGEFGKLVRSALRYDKVDTGTGKYPCPIQLGGINDPCDGIERQRGWMLEFIDLCIEFNQPVRVSSKGTVMGEPDYLKRLEKAPHLFWFAYSIISPDDELIAKVDKGAPVTSQRIAAMKKVTDIGCKASLRFRPMMPGLSDATPNYPRAYQSLVEMAYHAGARAVSAEVAFVPMRFTKPQKKLWEKMEKDIGKNLLNIYKKMGSSQTCFRASYRWTEQIMHYLQEVTQHYGMTLGVSDPNWKQLSETGCCCGMLPEDPVFGNWERENATHALLEAKRTGEPMTLASITPDWSKDYLQGMMCHLGAGPKVVYDKRHKTWADHLGEVFNQPSKERSPLNYFQGAVMPERTEDGELVYRYKGLERHHSDKTPHWNLLPPEL